MILSHPVPLCDTCSPACRTLQGLILVDKQKVSPWDLLEGHRNPAPLSWSWFAAIKLERSISKYEEVFKMMRSVGRPANERGLWGGGQRCACWVLVMGWCLLENGAL